ncbi:kinase-like domain-containing protein [Russula dissimulans]|nr:kinase-like domain-containing protein [Russula dissimulans]
MATPSNASTIYSLSTSSLCRIASTVNRLLSQLGAEKSTIDNGALAIEQVLGAGSFGVVYRARDTRSGVHYAVKCVEKRGSDYYQTRETQLHARVSSHPHVLTFHREIDGGDCAFFVYDLCAGDLHSVIRELTFFRKDELIKRVFIQIIDALEYCHSRGVYHRT